MKELINRIFVPEEDEDLQACLDFVKQMPGCATAKIIDENSIRGTFWKRII